jgi:hypothetical protein
MNMYHDKSVSGKNRLKEKPLSKKKKLKEKSGYSKQDDTKFALEGSNYESLNKEKQGL